VRRLGLLRTRDGDRHRPPRHADPAMADGRIARWAEPTTHLMLCRPDAEPMTSQSTFGRRSSRERCSGRRRGSGSCPVSRCAPGPPDRRTRRTFEGDRRACRARHAEYRRTATRRRMRRIGSAAGIRPAVPRLRGRAAATARVPRRRPARAAPPPAEERSGWENGRAVGTTITLRSQAASAGARPRRPGGDGRPSRKAIAVLSLMQGWSSRGGSERPLHVPQQCPVAVRPARQPGPIQLCPAPRSWSARADPAPVGMAWLQGTATT
jgi:hypothetical protein